VPFIFGAVPQAVLVFKSGSVAAVIQDLFFLSYLISFSSMIYKMLRLALFVLMAYWRINEYQFAYCRFSV